MTEFHMIDFQVGLYGHVWSFDFKCLDKSPPEGQLCETHRQEFLPCFILFYSCNITHTHTHTHIYIYIYIFKVGNIS